MKVRLSLFSILLLLIYASPLLANNITEPSKDKEESKPLTGIEAWLEGQVIGGNTLVTYFIISQGEFLEYVGTNNVQKITIDYFEEEKNGSSVEKIHSIDLTDLTAGFNVETWSGEVENIDTSNYIYLAQVTINDDVCGPKVFVELINEEIVEEEEDLPIELPEYECGESFVAENISNQTGLTSASPGTVFTIGGFPILVQTLNSGASPYTGTGIVPLPFGNEVVNVSFTNLHVNTDKQVYQGEAHAIAGDPANYPNFNANYEPYNIGGEICLPPPPPPGYNSEGVNAVTGLDDWGFDPTTGINNATGTAQDQNGFDVNGNHVSTGSPYNQEGCSREGLTESGEPCDPSGGPNPAAEAYADSIASTLGTTITTILNTLNTELQDSLSTLSCGGIRTEMEGLMSSLGYNRAFIFGEGDKYFEENMHLQFNEKPKPLVLNIARDPNAKTLEEKHIDLYDCDKSEYAIKAFIAAIQTMQNDTELLNQVLSKISAWTEYEYNLYSTDSDKFNDWLVRTLGSIMVTNSGLDDSYTNNEIERPNTQQLHQENIIRSAFEINRTSHLYSAVASSDKTAMFDETFTLEDASFYFRQGDQKINGIDRVFYLEELEKRYRRTGGGNDLPIKIDRTVGNKTYGIYLDNISFTTSGAVLDAYAIIDDPESGRRLSFKALDVSFGPTGLHTESRLHLDSDIEIRLNNAAMLILKGTEGTYVSWDCEGFSGMGVDAEIEFCRNFIIPLNPNTLEPLPDPEKYRLSIAVQDISSWLEFYLVVDAPPFAVAQYEDVKWELTNMILDFSSSETPTFTPLEGYTSPFWDGSQMSPAWRGFYMENLSATLPNDFSNGSEPITASAYDILIDGSGFTGGVAVENLITINDGNLAGWPFSIDEFEVRVIKNQFAGAGLAGKVNVPIFEENMEYEAVMFPGSEYSFTVSPISNAKVDMFLANAEIYSDSYIKIGKVGGEFLAVATLNGKMNVSTGDNSDVSVNLPSLCFEGFEVSNQAPYFSPGDWGLTGTGNVGVEVDFNGFGVRIDNIAPYSPGEGKGGLAFDLDLKLVNQLDLNTGGQFGIEGTLVEENGRQRWEFDRIDIGAFYIDASFPGAEISGLLEWYGSDENPDPEWGKGFRGVLSTKFEGFDLGLDAAAQFGEKDGYKYFFVDALADLGTGIGTGAIQLKGFGGGVSWNMDMNHSNVSLVSSSGNFNLPPIGTSFSGTQYSPNPNGGLGLKATVIIASLKEEVFNGTVSLIIDFNGNNGLNAITLTGSGQFLTPIDLGIKPDFLPGAAAAPSTVDASLSAFIDLTFNFSEPSFHGNLNAFLNAGILRGSGDGGKMVDAELHFDPNQWYIYIGRPEEGQRCGIIFEIPGVGEIEAGAYFDIGTVVPPMPDLPANVKEIAYLVNDNQSFRTSGAGFVMGASVKFEMSAKIAGIISSTLNAAAGFDMMLRKYEGVSCQGSNEPIGIDGWYASGQMYAYIDGQLSVFGVNIVEAGLAAVLQARLPNPFFAQATVGVKIKVPFGTVQKSLKVELGNDCILVSNDPQAELGIEVILSMSPYEGVTDMETSIIPQADFALELRRDYNIADLQGVEQTYRAKLKDTKMTNSNGLSIAHNIRQINGGAAIQLVPREMLPSNDSIYFEVTVEVFKNGSLLTEETKSTYFFTGDGLNYIPERNVAASYPANGMVNFYKKEYVAHEGFIDLKIGQPDLLVNNIPSGKEQKVRFTSAGGQTFDVSYQYNPLSKQITFPMPPHQLTSGAMYKLEMVRIDEGSSNGGGSSSSNSSTSALGTALSGNNSSTGSGPNVGEEKGSSTGIEQEQEVLFTLYFRVSEHDKFNDKLDAISSLSVQNGNDDEMHYDFSNEEGFDQLEITGTNDYDALVSFKANLSNQWYNNEAKPAFDQIEPLLCGNWGDVPSISELSKRSVGVTGANTVQEVKESNFSNGTIDFGNQKLSYKVWSSANSLFYIWVSDAFSCSFGSGGSFAGNYNLLCGEDEYPTECLVWDYYNNSLEFPPLNNGSYGVQVTYELPNGLKTTDRTIQFVK